MSTLTNRLNDGINSANWRQSPPHLVVQLAGDTGPVDATFHTANSQTEDAGDSGQPASAQTSENPESMSRLSTRSPETGLVITLQTDASRRHFFYEVSTGLRFGLAADLNTMSTDTLEALLHRDPAVTPKTLPTPSEKSDVTPGSDSGSIGTTCIDEGLTALLSEVNPAVLTPPQRALLLRAQGALSTGCTRLLSSTALTVDHHGITKTMHDSLVRLRDDIAIKITALHTEINSERVTLETHISANAAALHEMGTSEAAIATAIGKMKTGPTPTPT
ncbi:hypothetical protein B0H11DRAFT_1942496 [Mycena galericulata]|nr:hypothetical protein B0H11DRAFT_1942496 [Mycena galericulata]